MGSQFVCVLQFIGDALAVIVMPHSTEGSGQSRETVHFKEMFLITVFEHSPRRRCPETLSGFGRRGR